MAAALDLKWSTAGFRSWRFLNVDWILMATGELWRCSAGKLEKSALLNCASGHYGEVAMLKAMWQIRPGVRCLGCEYQLFHLSHFFTPGSLSLFICKWDIIIS